ncbi:MAG: DUF2244 domain-containing protein [Pseudooceanicola sp.]|nr:DUF2244 domain-containing protein [Pseudooceanicola sp.]
MPYEWHLGPGRERRLLLWPHRSLPPRGFAAVILITFAMLMIPTLSLLGRAALWGLLPFVLGALALLWISLRRSYRDGRLTEEMLFADGEVVLTRREPNGSERDWKANPYFVQVHLHQKPVENYLTLSGGNREVEIGAFLSPEERLALREELEAELARAAGYATPGG